MLKSIHSFLFACSLLSSCSLQERFGSGTNLQKQESSPQDSTVGGGMVLPPSSTEEEAPLSFPQEVSGNTASPVTSTSFGTGLSDQSQSFETPVQELPSDSSATTTTVGVVEPSISVMPVDSTSPPLSLSIPSNASHSPASAPISSLSSDSNAATFVENNSDGQAILNSGFSYLEYKAQRESFLYDSSVPNFDATLDQFQFGMYLRRVIYTPKLEKVAFFDTNGKPWTLNLEKNNIQQLSYGSLVGFNRSARYLLSIDPGIPVNRVLRITDVEKNTSWSTGIKADAAFFHESGSGGLSIFYLDETCDNIQGSISSKKYKSLWRADVVTLSETVINKRIVLSAATDECFSANDKYDSFQVFGNQISITRHYSTVIGKGASDNIVDISNDQNVTIRRAVRSSVFDTNWYQVMSRFPLTETHERFIGTDSLYFGLASLVTSSYSTTFFGDRAAQDKVQRAIKHLTGARLGLSKPLLLPIPTDNNRIFASHVGDDAGKFLPFVLLVEPGSNSYQLLYLKDLSLRAGSAIYYLVSEKKLLYVSTQNRVQIAVPNPTP